MDISIVIAQMLGVFMVVMGVAMLVNNKGVAAAVEESAQHKGILFVWGMLALITGAVIVVLNNIWTNGLSLLVTIIGWLALVKGAFVLIFPGAAATLYRKCGKGGAMAAYGVVALIVGIVLLYW